MTGEKLSNRDSELEFFVAFFHNINFLIFPFFSNKVDMILQEVNPTKDGKIRYAEMLKVLSTPMRDH